MTGIVTRAVGLAMATQLERVNDSPERLKERIQEMQVEINRLREQIDRQRRTIEDLRGTAPETAIEHHLASHDILAGRPVGNQSDFARMHNVPAYQVSRWCTAGDIQFQRRNGKYIVYLDQPCPPTKKRGRKKA